MDAKFGRRRRKAKFGIWISENPIKLKTQEEQIGCILVMDVVAAPEIRELMP